MGPYIKYTKNLILQVENESKAKEVLDLYLRNRYVFEQFEPTRPFDFYTIDYHYSMLYREYNAFLRGNFIRYYIYRPSNMSRIIGAINFNIHMDSVEPYAEIGYKIDQLYQNQGLCYEACLACLQVIKNDYGIHKVDARIHPDNKSSIALARKLGFKPLYVEPQSANVMGKYVDLVRYSLTISDIQ